MFSNDTNQPKSTVEPGCLCPLLLSCPAAVTAPSTGVEIQKDTSTKLYNNI